MTTQQMQPKPGSVLANLSNLTARALMGEWPTEEALRNQVMRVYRLVQYDAPADGVAVTFGLPGAVAAPEPVAQAAPVQLRAHTHDAGGIDQHEAPAVQVAASHAECPQRGNHKNAKRLNQACSDCGYPNITAVVA